MVKGIGIDILKISNILENNLKQSDSFFKKTYSLEEIQQAKTRQNPKYYYATRFSAKEAVFKCFNINGERTILNEITILDDEDGKPSVKLSGEFLKLAKAKNIDEILITISYEEEYAVAFAVAQSK